VQLYFGKVDALIMWLSTSSGRYLRFFVIAITLALGKGFGKFLLQLV
jgi:hypothetical protein